jgi:hypothetical protein
MHLKELPVSYIYFSLFTVCWTVPNNIRWKRFCSAGRTALCHWIAHSKQEKRRASAAKPAAPHVLVASLEAEDQLQALNLLIPTRYWCNSDFWCLIFVDRKHCFQHCVIFARFFQMTLVWLVWRYLTKLTKLVNGVLCILVTYKWILLIINKYVASSDTWTTHNAPGLEFYPLIYNSILSHFFCVCQSIFRWRQSMDLRQNVDASIVVKWAKYL